MKKPLLIGIAGGSASGKTLISKKIFEQFNDYKSVVVIRQDDYYNNQDHLSFDERLKVNYDHPLAFDNDFLIKHLNDLLNYKAIDKPKYDFVNYNRFSETEKIDPAEVIVIEGLFVLEDKRIRDLLDIKIFVDADADIRFIRRMIRDVRDRGRTIDSIVSHYTNTVKPMHEQFVEPSKRYADIIVLEGGKNKVAVDLINTKISSILNIRNL